MKIAVFSLQVRKAHLVHEAYERELCWVGVVGEVSIETRSAPGPGGQRNLPTMRSCDMGSDWRFYNRGPRKARCKRQPDGAWS